MTTFNGLPAHIPLVHAIVVLLPLAALVLVLTAVWPAARRRLAAFNVILSAMVVVLTPITTHAGEWLDQRVPHTALLRDHTELGDSAIMVVLPVAALALVVWWREREMSGPVAALRRPYLAPRSTTVTVVVAVLAVLVAGVAVGQIYRIGDSGSKAAWYGRTGSAAAVPSGH